MIVKICKIHGELILEEISKKKECKKCNVISRKKHYEKNKIKYKEKSKIRSRLWRKNNSDKQKENNENYKKNHHEKLKEISRNSAKKARIKYKEKINIAHLKYSKKSAKDLSNWYVKVQIAKKFKMKAKDVPMWMIPIFRSIYQLKRKRREINENKKY